MASGSGHRQWYRLRGEHAETARRAREALDAFSREDVLWVTPDDDEGAVAPSRVRHHLGESFDAAVLDWHREFDPDVLGRIHGVVRGGGSLLLRLPPEGRTPPRLGSKLAAHPFDADDVGLRLWHRVEERLVASAEPDPGALAPPSFTPSRTDDQDELVARLVQLWREGSPSDVVVEADRGRGKSSGVGRALRRLRRASDEFEAAVTARSPNATAEIFRFALGDDDIPRSGAVRFVPVADLLVGESPDAGRQIDLVVVDEAAQLSVPVLRRLVAARPATHLLFATTTHGYEGTGRGFDLRFSDWLADASANYHAIELVEPIRWRPDDPLEDAVFDTLLLEAEPTEAQLRPTDESVEHRCFDRDALAQHETCLRETFGLLVGAHYRTTPADLHRMLDAPNIDVHAILSEGRPLAATLIAREGDLPDDLARDVYWGERIRGHAIPELLLSTLGLPTAGELRVVRSLRTAVHPNYRRRGLGSRLVDEVHRSYSPDLFGSIFGAQPAMIRLRRRLGHSLIRLSPSRGRRAGEPSVSMLRAETPRGEAVVEQLQDEFARKLPLQLDFIDQDRRIPLDDELRELVESCAEDREVSIPERRIEEVVTHFAFGPPTYEAAAFAVEPFVEGHADALPELEPTHRQLIESRVQQRDSWTRTAEAAGLETVRAAMRALRRALRALVERAAPRLAPDDF